MSREKTAVDAVPAEARDGHVHTGRDAHTHADDGHARTHPHTSTQAVVNRLAKAAGHLKSVKAMVEDGRDCSEVLIQLAAVRSALNRTAEIILKDHLEHCVVDAAASGDSAALEALNRAIELFMK